MAPEPPVISKQSKPSRSPSPVQTEGAGDVLSIEDTNKLRAKLGLKPLEVGPSVTESANSRNDDNEEKDEATADLKKVKDDWGEFYHKPAGVFNEKSEVEKLREKIQSKRDKRKIEQKLAQTKTLGESDSDDDPSKWVEKNRRIQEEKKKAKDRSRMFEEMDEEMDIDPREARRREPKKRSYKEKDLKGLKVAHDIESFTEDRHVILTLKDADVLGEDDDTLVNVNMIDNERYKKNVQVRKQNPLHYGYDVYEEQYDQFGNFIGRGVLGKYDDDEIDGNKRTTFTLGESKELMQEQQRKAMEIKAKLMNKTLETLNDEPLKLASDHYTEEELTKFKKPKKKVKKIRQKLKADDLLEIAGDSTEVGKDIGSRKRRDVALNIDDVPSLPDVITNVKDEADDDDLEQVLRKARRLKQKANIIKKDIHADDIKIEVKVEPEETEEEIILKNEGFITLNQTAEFCRTLGDIPTYGMAGNRDDNTDVMDIEENAEDEEAEEIRRGKWNAVDPNDEPKLMEGIQNYEHDDAAILDEEPDVASGVAAALQLAMSKGYIEKEDNNRPSNSRFAHLQAQNYSIDDKTHGEDDKYARRSNASERFNGPTTDFREKSGYKPNVKLEYIDDNNQKLTPKEAFRYLSHKFHGKGPGKNKIEKRLKKIEQEVVSVVVKIEYCKYLMSRLISVDEEDVVIGHSAQHSQHVAAETEGDVVLLCRAQWQ